MATAIGPGLTKSAVAAKVAGQVIDIRKPLSDGDEVAIITKKDPEGNTVTETRSVTRTEYRALAGEHVGYITDVIVRPRPLVVAGRLERYGNDFASRTFEMTLKTDPALGATEMFVPAERHYPQGFRVDIGEGLTLEQSGKTVSLRTARAVADEDREQARLIRWDDARQHLTIDRWVGPARSLAIKISPLAPEQQEL